MATAETTLKPASLVAKHAATVIKFLLTLAASAFIAYGAAQYRAGSQVERTDARLHALEEHALSVDQAIVPRAEHEAHWRAMEQTQTQMQTDLREVRETEREILLKLSK